MNKVFLLPILFLAGCTVTPQQPIDVAMIPDDCANRQAITRWLEQVAGTPRSSFQTKEQYENNVSMAKHRMWHIRYVCQPA